jgi:hypothetical protein
VYLGDEWRIGRNAKGSSYHSMHGVSLKPDEWMGSVPNNGWETVRRHIAVQPYGHVCITT